MTSLDTPLTQEFAITETVQNALVLPAYKEFNRPDVFRDAIDSYQNFFDDRLPGFELIVFADGCEKTAKLAESLGATVMRHADGENHGRGKALKEAMTRISDSRVSDTAINYAYGDADGSYSAEHIMKLLEAIDSGYDFAASHRLDNSDTSIARRVAHVGLSRLCGRIAPIGIKDAQAGAKAFSQKFVDEVFPQTVTERWAFDRELAVIANRDGYATSDIGAHITTQEQSTVRPIHDTVEMINHSLLIRKQHLTAA